MNQRPLTADEIEKLSEHLWQFTMFNNSDYVVERSTRSSSANSLVQTILVGQLVRGAAGTCDTAQLSELDAHDECRGWHFDAFVEQRPIVSGEEHIIGRREMHWLIIAELSHGTYQSQPKTSLHRSQTKQHDCHPHPSGFRYTNFPGLLG
jgi:hypothetical protein